MHSTSKEVLINVSLPLALLVRFAGGAVWQFALVVAVVGLEHRSVRWSTVREALRAPFTAESVVGAPRYRPAGRSRERRD